jgi:hypothetical protein
MKKQQLPLNAVGLMGKSLMVYLKNGKSFYLKVTAGGPGHISGQDQEGMNLVVNFTDIDCVVG